MDSRIMDVIERIETIGEEGRELNNLVYRAGKLAEEAGECCGAVISVDTKSYKNLTYMDVLEEAIDTLIVSIDIIQSKFPEFENLSQEEINDIKFSIIKKKLDKWENKKNRGEGNG